MINHAKCNTQRLRHMLRVNPLQWVEGSAKMGLNEQYRVAQNSLKNARTSQDIGFWSSVVGFVRKKLGQEARLLDDAAVARREQRELNRSEE